MLSHWPAARPRSRCATTSRPRSRSTTSTIPSCTCRAEFVSNNHFDQDGLMSVYALVDPDGRAVTRERGRSTSPAPATSAPSTTATASASRGRSRSSRHDAPGRRSVPRAARPAAELLDHPERYREHWADEDAHLEASEAAIWSGESRSQEIPELDLAVVPVPDELDRATGPPLHHLGPRGRGASRARSTTRPTASVLTVHGGSYELEYRYETWVRYLARRPLGRVDLSPLAAELDRARARRRTLGLRRRRRDRPDAAPDRCRPERRRARSRRSDFRDAGDPGADRPAISAWNPYD